MVSQTAEVVDQLLRRGFSIDDIVVLTGRGVKRSLVLKAEHIGSHSTRRFSGTSRPGRPGRGAGRDRAATTPSASGCSPSAASSSSSACTRSSTGRGSSRGRSCRRCCAPAGSPAAARGASRSCAPRRAAARASPPPSRSLALALVAAWAAAQPQAGRRPRRRRARRARRGRHRARTHARGRGRRHRPAVRRPAVRAQRGRGGRAAARRRAGRARARRPAAAGVPDTWIRLAQFQLLAGNAAAAQRTVRPALYLDPRSAPAQAIFLEASRKLAAAERAKARAKAKARRADGRAPGRAGGRGGAWPAGAGRPERPWRCRSDAATLRERGGWCSTLVPDPPRRTIDPRPTVDRGGSSLDSRVRSATPAPAPRRAHARHARAHASRALTARRPSAPAAPPAARRRARAHGHVGEPGVAQHRRERARGEEPQVVGARVQALLERAPAQRLDARRPGAAGSASSRAASRPSAAPAAPRRAGRRRRRRARASHPSRRRRTRPRRTAAPRPRRPARRAPAAPARARAAPPPPETSTAVTTAPARRSAPPRTPRRRSPGRARGRRRARGPAAARGARRSAPARRRRAPPATPRRASPPRRRRYGRARDPRCAPPAVVNSTLGARPGGAQNAPRRRSTAGIVFTRIERSSDDRPVLEVEEVEPDEVVEVQLRAARHLPQPGDARQHEVALAMPVLELVVVALGQRPRPDERHLAARDVPQLRQLVEREAPQHPSDRRHARVVAHLEQRAVRLVVMLELGLVARRRPGTSCGTSGTRTAAPPMPGRIEW